MKSWRPSRIHQLSSLFRVVSSSLQGLTITINFKIVHPVNNSLIIRSILCSSSFKSFALSQNRPECFLTQWCGSRPTFHQVPFILICHNKRSSPQLDTICTLRIEFSRFLNEPDSKVSRTDRSLVALVIVKKPTYPFPLARSIHVSWALPSPDSLHPFGWWRAAAKQNNLPTCASCHFLLLGGQRPSRLNPPLKHFRAQWGTAGMLWMAIKSKTLPIKLGNV